MVLLIFVINLFDFFVDDFLGEVLDVNVICSFVIGDLIDFYNKYGVER